MILRDKLGDELFRENFTRVDMSHGAIAVYFEKKSLFKGKLGGELTFEKFHRSR